MEAILSVPVVELVGWSSDSGSWRSRAAALPLRISAGDRILLGMEQPSHCLYLVDEETRRIDVRKVAGVMDVDPDLLVEKLGLEYSVAQHPVFDDSIQEALAPIRRTLDLLFMFFQSEKAIRLWLRTPHPDLGGATALATILEGKADVVAIVLGNASEGIPL